MGSYTLDHPANTSIIKEHAVKHHLCLHPGGDVQCDIGCRATSTPGYVTEYGPMRNHALLPLEQSLNTL